MEKERVRKRIYKTPDLAPAGIFDYIEDFSNGSRRADMVICTASVTTRLKALRHAITAIYLYHQVRA